MGLKTKIGRIRKLNAEKKSEIIRLCSKGVTDTEISKITGINVSHCAKISTQYWEEKMEKKYLDEE